MEYKFIKILSLITGSIFLIDISSYAKGGGETTLEKEQKNEVSTKANLKNDDQENDTDKNNNQKKYIIETKKEDKKDVLKVNMEENSGKKDKNFLNRKRKRNKDSDTETKEVNLKKKKNDDGNVSEDSNEKDNKLLGKKRERSEDAPENPTKVTGKVVDIAGFKFHKLLTNKYGQTLYVCVANPYNIFIEIGGYRYDESVNKGSICFSQGIFGKRGETHFVEHIASKRSVGRSWPALAVSDTNEEVGMNAMTGYLDYENNIIELELDLKKKVMFDEKFVKELSDMLLGKKDFVKDFKYLFETEKNRVISEMHGKQEGIKDGGTESIIGTELRRLFYKNKFDSGGKWDEIKKLTFEDMWKYYNRNVVNGNPTAYFRFKDMKQAEKSLALFAKYYFNYKTKENCKLAKPGKKKLDDDFIKCENVRKEFAETFKTFEFSTGKEGDKTSKKAQNKVDYAYNTYGLDYFKKECINCYNVDYLESIPEVKELMKKYMLKGIKINGGTPEFHLNIYTDNRKILTEEKLKEVEKEIIDIIIGYIDRNKIKFEDLTNAESFERMKQELEEKDFNFMQISNDINLSYILEGKPFSKKYFRFNEKGELEHDPKVFEKYCRENYTKILREILEETKRRIIVYEREKGSYDLIKDFVDDTSFRYIPIKIRTTDGKEKFLSRAELSVAQDFVENNISQLFDQGKKRGRLYSSFMRASQVFNRFSFHPSSNLDIENFEDICKNHLKKELKNLKLDDSYLKKSIDTYKKLVENSKKSLLLTKNLINEKQKKTEALLKKNKITFKDIRKLDEKMISNEPLMLALRIIKLDYSEYSKLIEELQQLDNEDLKLREATMEVFNKTENKTTVLSERAKRIYKKGLKIIMKKRKFVLDKISKALEKIKEIQELKVKFNGRYTGITPDYIRAIMKNIEFLDYEKVNKEEKKKDLEKIQKLKKKYRNKGMEQIKKEILRG